MRDWTQLDRVIAGYFSMSENEIHNVMPEAARTELPAICKYIIDAGGKRLRPLLTILACDAVRGDCKKAVPVSVAIELAHTLAIIQDDIFDQATMRRGVKAVHVVWGTPKAILASDYLFLKMVESVLKTANSDLASRELALQILNVVVSAGLEAVEGEYHDLQLSKKDEATVEECITIAVKKTGAFMRAALEVGALVGGGSQDEIRSLARYGEKLGMVYQIIDDVLGLTGNQNMIGKDTCADIKNKRMTVVTAYAFQNASSTQRRKLLEALRDPAGCSQNPVTSISEIVHETQALEFARKLASEFKDKAVAELKPLKSSDARDILEVIPAMVVDRKW